MQPRPIRTLLVTLALSLLCACASPDTDTSPYKVVEPSADYPLETCIVTGEMLGSMGGVAAINYEGTEVQLCCETCLQDFLADPDTYLAKLEAETAR